MLIEYPDYLEKFRCIGGKCPDTCCAGWEVDVDEESFYYYQTVPGKFGTRLRRHLREDGGAKFFPMTREKRCPFLNPQNLCDIYTELGEDRLCQVCTEYPRYFMCIGNYEQIDLSLSCMEFGRIFFTEWDEIRYCRGEDKEVGEALTAEVEQALVTALAVRNQGILLLQEDRPLAEKLEALRGLMEEAVLPATADPVASQGNVFGEKSGSESTASEAGTKSLSCSADVAEDDTALKALVQRLGRMEVLDRRWSMVLRALRALTRSREKRRQVLKWLAALRQNSHYNEWFSKLAVYFCFRYTIDAALDGDFQRSFRMIRRSLETIELMCLLRVLPENNLPDSSAGGEYMSDADSAPKTFARELSIEDMIDISHLYSKQVEHDEQNVEIMKE